MRSKKEKTYKLYIDYDVIQAHEDLLLLLESLRADLHKSVLSGSKTSGIRSRHGIKAAKKLLDEILKNCLSAERAAKSVKKPHGNKIDPVGIKTMLKKRNIDYKGDKENE